MSESNVNVQKKRKKQIGPARIPGVAGTGRIGAERIGLRWKSKKDLQICPRRAREISPKGKRRVRSPRTSCNDIRPEKKEGFRISAFPWEYIGAEGDDAQITKGMKG